MAMLVLLAIRGLGKIEAIVRLLPVRMRDPEQSLTKLMTDMPDFLPSACLMDDDQKHFISHVLRVNTTFNMNQYLQGENTPGEIEELKKLLKMINDPDVFKSYIL